jgi:alkanesulfonate monooxygenase SsuD/methylene tetrahydromethanopterin reductase-like flavin-dependent oxidoreductase (luciferase family)/putative sterol carrier protein
MRFGLFYEHQLPRPWAPGSEERLLWNALEQIELADTLGFDHVWEVEHHFLEEYSHSSAPEVFLAAASQRTARIRLGHGIVQLPSAVNHPARVAERIATLDLVSGGRVDFGTGEGSSQVELGGFGVPRADKRQQWEEALEVVCRMLTEEPFSGHRGEWLDVPPRNVVPKPKQRPHPPLWVACSRRETIELAARRGIGALSFSFVEPEEAKPWVEAYYRLLASPECVPAGQAVNPNLAVVVPFMCHPDEETAIERGIDGAHFFGYSLAHYYVFGRHRPGRTDVWQEFERYRHERGFARDLVRADRRPLEMRLLEGTVGSLRGAVGTPDQIRDLVARYQEAGVDQVIFVAQAGRNQHDHICEALELFGREVLPEFAEGREEREKAKRERLAGAVEAGLARRPSGPVRPGVSSYVVSAEGELTPARPTRSRRRTVRDLRPQQLVERAVEAILGRLLARVPEGIAGRVAVSAPSLMAFRKGMGQRFSGHAPDGLAAALRFELTADGSSGAWTLRVANGQVTTAPGADGEVDAVIRLAGVDFLRMAAGELGGGEALFDQRLTIEGDEAVALRVLTELDPGGAGY